MGIFHVIVISELLYDKQSNFFKDFDFFDGHFHLTKLQQNQ